MARAIADHYRPRFSGDALPESRVGKVVAMADKLDTICGLFAIGQGPTGSSDPFALRRAAIGIVSILFELPGVLLGEAIDVALERYAEAGIAFDQAAVRAAVADFFVTRTKVMLRDEGRAADAIDAVLAVGVEEPMELVRRVRALEEARTGAREAFDDLATAYARANNLAVPELGAQVDAGALSGAELDLARAVGEADAACRAALAADDYAGALAALAALRGPVDRFFEDVLVMDEDADARERRLRLLNAFVAVFSQVADFGAMARGK